MLNLFKLVFDKEEKNIGGFLKAHLQCNNIYSQEFKTEYTCNREILNIKCYHCNENITFYPSGEILNNELHKIKTFSRSQSIYKPKSSL